MPKARLKASNGRAHQGLSSRSGALSPGGTCGKWASARAPEASSAASSRPRPSVHPVTRAEQLAGLERRATFWQHPLRATQSPSARPAAGVVERRSTSARFSCSSPFDALRATAVAWAWRRGAGRPGGHLMHAARRPRPECCASAHRAAGARPVDDQRRRAAPGERDAGNTKAELGAGGPHEKANSAPADAAFGAASGREVDRRPRSAPSRERPCRL